MKIRLVLIGCLVSTGISMAGILLVMKNDLMLAQAGERPSGAAVKYFFIEPSPSDAAPKTIPEETEKTTPSDENRPENTPVAAAETDRPSEAQPPENLPLHKEKTGLPAEEENLLRSIDIPPGEGETRVHILAGKKIPSTRIFILQNPPRLVLDLEGLKSPFQGEQRQHATRTPVQQIRHFAHDNKVRVVLDMEENWPGTYSTQDLENGLEIRLGHGKGTLAEGHSPDDKGGVPLAAPGLTRTSPALAVAVKTIAVSPENTPDPAASQISPPVETETADADVALGYPEDTQAMETETAEVEILPELTEQQKKLQYFQSRLAQAVEKAHWLEPQDILLRLRKFGDGGRELIPVITDILEKRDHPYAQYRFTQKAALETLGAIQPEAEDVKKLEPLLVSYLSERHFALRKATVTTMGQIGIQGEEAYRALCKTAKSDASSPVREAAVIAMGRTAAVLRADGFEVLVEKTRDKNSHVRLAAVRILSGLTEKNPEALKPLEQACMDLNAEVRLVASAALGEAPAHP